MASTQNIERALREKFGSEETIVTLAEVLAFLKLHQNSHCAAGNPKNQKPTRGTQQNAPPSQGQAREQTRKERVTPQTSQSAQSSAKTQGSQSSAKTQSSQSSAKPPEAVEPQGSPKAPVTQPQRLSKQPSYAEIVKKASGNQAKNTQKPKALPKSLQNSLKPPPAIKITLREPLGETLVDLMNRIKSQNSI